MSEKATLLHFTSYQSWNIAEVGRDSVTLGVDPREMYANQYINRGSRLSSAQTSLFRVTEENYIFFKHEKYTQDVRCYGIGSL